MSRSKKIGMLKEYVAFKKRYIDSNIMIFVECCLYNNNAILFNDIFGNVIQIHGDNTKEGEAYFIVDLNNIVESFWKNNSDSVIFCNTREEGWIFHMLTQLEEFIVRDKGEMVFHGACVQYRGTALIIVGERGAGKSTLVSELCKLADCLYVDDDIIFFDSKSLYGLNFPIRLRYFKDNERYICATTFDEEGCKRYLHLPSDKVFSAGKPGLILFTKYNEEETGIKKIVSYECFLRLLINTRYCAEKENRIKLITLLAQDTEAYDISYKDCRFVIEFLNATLKERRI